MFVCKQNVSDFPCSEEYKQTVIEGVTRSYAEVSQTNDITWLGYLLWS